MTYNLDQLIAEAAAYEIDPDRTRYPHLFKEYKFTQEEIDKHHANLSPKSPVAEHPYHYLGTLAKDKPKLIKLDESRYFPWSGISKVMPRSKLKLAGWFMNKTGERSTVTYVEPDTWLDESTGELITKSSARRDGIRIPLVKSISARMIDTILRIKKCAPSEREFVIYVLKMRSNRGGLVVDLKTVIDLWINQEYADIRSSDKSRLRKRLATILDKQRIMINTQTLASDLQVLGNPTKREIIEESARVYDVLKPRAKPSRGASAKV